MQTSESSAMPAADAAPAFYTAVASNGCALAQYSASTEEGVIFNVLSVARNDGFKGSGLDRLIELGWVVRPVYTQPAAPQAVQAAAPLPLLLRDIARDLGITVPQACIALKPLGNYSTNSAVTAEMARMLRDHFPATAHPVEGEVQ